MEFLKEILGENLYSQFAEKVNAYNGDEANKEKQIKIGNLGTGEYVGKGKFDALQELMNGKETELTSANELIASLKKGTKDNEGLQEKIAAYEQQNADLQAQLQETKLKSAVKVALLSEKAVDVDYLTFKLNEKLNEKGESLELDENDNIKGWDKQVEGLKVQFPTMFETKIDGDNKNIIENKLPKNDDKFKAVTKEQFAAMTYEQRAALKEENEELFRQLNRH